MSIQKKYYHTFFGLLFLLFCQTTCADQKETALDIHIQNVSSKPFKVTLYGTGGLNDYHVHQGAPTISAGENGKILVQFKPPKESQPASIHHTLILSQENQLCTVEYTTSTSSNTQYYFLTSHQLHSTLDKVQNQGVHCTAWVENDHLLKIQVDDADDDVVEEE